MSLAERLADYALTLRFADLDDQVVHVAKQRIVDSVGCALGAIDSAPARAIRSYLHTLSRGSATLMFERRKVTPDAATFLNATMVRFLDFNDGYFAREPGHPSDIIAALLAAAETERLGARDVLVAMVVAYEIQMRLQDAACLFRKGWDHVNFVTISATLATGRLLGLNKGQLVHALGMALNSHIAMRQVRSGELSGWKGASAANAARNAVFCCYLARHGMTGPDQIFEGEMAFMNQVSGPFELDVAAFGNGRTHDYAMTRIRTKPFPTNGEMQTAVLAALALRDDVGSADDVRSIQVDTTDVGVRILAKDRAKWRPQTRETADHSLPYTVARALLDGAITRQTYDAADLDDPEVLRLIDKISVREDPDLTAQMPSLANRVTVTMADGRILSREYGARSSPPFVISDRQIEDKFRDFAADRFPQARIQEIIDLLWAFDEQPDVTRVFEVLALEDGRA